MLRHRSTPQLFSSHLPAICDPRHPIRILADGIDWESLISRIAVAFPATTGRPPEDPRLVLGLLLKDTYGESDESCVARFVESINWKYFCGMQEIQWKCPVDPTTLGRWRKRLADKGLSELLTTTIQAGLSTRAVRLEDTKHLIVDTTVQEKAIAHPTDARLCHRKRQKLVAVADRAGINLRQSYERVGMKLFIRHNRQRHLKHRRLANESLKELRTKLGAVMRDLQRKADQAPAAIQEKIREALDLATRVHGQVKQKKAAGRVFSLHEPEVDCIGKGKAHKKWEFGCKLGLVSTSRSNFNLTSKAYSGNPYDGHILSDLPLDAMKQVPFPWRPQVSVDQGEKLAAVLSACGYNLRQCLRAIARTLASLFGLDENDLLRILNDILNLQTRLRAAA